MEHTELAVLGSILGIPKKFDNDVAEICRQQNLLRTVDRKELYIVYRYTGYLVLQKNIYIVDGFTGLLVLKTI